MFCIMIQFRQTYFIVTYVNHPYQSRHSWHKRSIAALPKHLTWFHMEIQNSIRDGHGKILQSTTMRKKTIPSFLTPSLNEKTRGIQFQGGGLVVDTLKMNLNAWLWVKWCLCLFFITFTIYLKICWAIPYQCIYSILHYSYSYPYPIC